MWKYENHASYPWSGKVDLISTIKARVPLKLNAFILYNLLFFRDVHIRIEDNRTNKGYPFGAGITLDKLDICTNKQDRVSNIINLFYAILK